jgi:hypothetical protein
MLTPPGIDALVNARAAHGGNGAVSQAVPPAVTPSNAAARLVSLADDFECWHSPTGDPYVAVPVADHRETFPLGSSALRSLLVRRFYLDSHRVPNRETITEALGVLEGRARFDGEEHPVAVRLAEHDGAVYLDLGDALWRVIEVTQEGWRVIDKSPVRFRRPRGALALPEPVRGGCVDELRDVALPNLTDATWRLLCAWLVMAFRPRGPYPVLELNGEQGSGKSTVGRVLRHHIDPNVAALRAEPRDVRDLVIAASNSWCLALDNLSRVQPWLSDQLCRLATGGGFATRELYSDLEEVLIDVQRPVPADWHRRPCRPR